jgi:tetratricopeptide (TPR) repeat protein
VDKFHLARAYYLTQQYHRAIHLLTAHGLVDTVPHCLRLAAQAHAACKEWPEVLALCKPDMLAQVEQALASTHDEEEEEVQAFAALEPATGVLSGLWLLQGLAYKALDNRPAACTALQRALQLDVDCFEAAECLFSEHMLSLIQGLFCISFKLWGCGGFFPLR